MEKKKLKKCKNIGETEISQMTIQKKQEHAIQK